MQILVNIVLQASILLLISLSFSMHYYATKFFNLLQAATISVAAYLTYLFLIKLHLPFFLAFLISIVCSVAISIVCEIGIYRYMRSKKCSSFALLIASVGLYTIIQNLISLFFGDETKSIRTSEVKVGHPILGAYATDIQIITVAISIILFFALLLLLQRTSFGKQVRAISNNPELCNIYGVNSNRVMLWVAAISSSLAAIAGILIALDVDMTPAFGFNYFLYGVVAMVIGGVGSYSGVFLGSLLLATAQQLAAYYIDTKWTSAVAYFILILFLIWKPLGFSGQQLKKIEV
jgi:branched-chain amino acid transport system permease protein